MDIILKATVDRRIFATRGLLLLLAAGLLLLSFRLPWWSLVLRAPQYPQGLRVTSTLQSLSGDVQELNNLNHYIGFIALEKAATLERELITFALPAMAVLAVVSLLFTGWLAWIFAVPLIAMPAVFLIDLKAWLYYAGHHLDPQAAMSSSIKPFTPTLLGTGKIAQFVTVGSLHSGFYLALAAAALAVAATLLARRQQEQ